MVNDKQLERSPDIKHSSLLNIWDLCSGHVISVDVDLCHCEASEQVDERAAGRMSNQKR